MRRCCDDEARSVEHITSVLQPLGSVCTWVTENVPIDRLAGRIVTAGGIAPGMELGFHLLRRAGYGQDLVAERARVMECSGHA